MHWRFPYPSSVMAGLVPAIPVFLFLIALALPAFASPISQTQYETTMQALDALQTRMIEVIAAFEKGMMREEAVTLKPEFDEKLIWLRRIKMEASQAGVATSHTKLKSALYPRCIVLRAGRLDPHLQDLTVNLALQVKNNPDTDYIPMDQALSVFLPSSDAGCRTIN